MANRRSTLPQLTLEEMTPPVIQPVPLGIKRPRWSVMIPTFNCARFLRETLESVLSQDIEPAEMQIEVVDDCSTLDNPEKIVNAYGNGRVAFFRQKKNVGATKNFNTCIARSRGLLVHILHGDDYVLPGFYSEAENALLSADPPVLFASRVFFGNEQGDYTSVSKLFENLSPSYSQVEALISTYNPFEFAGVVVKRTAYECYGGFITSLVHAADWEMWLRMTSQAPVVLSNKVLAFYRCHDSSDSSTIALTAQDLADCARLETILLSLNYNVNISEYIRSTNEKALAQAIHFLDIGKNNAAMASFKFWLSRISLFCLLKKSPRLLAVLVSQFLEFRKI